MVRDTRRRAPHHEGCLSPKLWFARRANLPQSESLILPPNQIHICTVPPHRGAARDRHGRGAGCGGRGVALLTRARTRGRRSRVVLTPRRWRQASRRYPLGDGGKQARSPGRARYKLLKPLRGECRVNRCDRGDYTRVLPTHCTRGYGRIGRPAFPAPSDFRGTKDSCTTRAHPAARPRRRVLSLLFEISSSIGMLRAGAPRSQLSSPATGSAQRAAR
jgi:hypothetical protein